MVVELVALRLWLVPSGRADRLPLVVSFLGAGVGFAAALFLARLPGANPFLFGLALLLAGVCHLWHLRQLLKRK